MFNKSNIGNVIGWLFGLLAFAIGVVNTFWGNDPGFGIFILLLSLLYFPPLNKSVKKKTGLAVPTWLKIVIGVFILWAALGVGELFDKIHLMITDLNL